MKENVLVIGGAGYVGARLVDSLLRLDYNVTVLDLFIYDKNIFDKYKNLDSFKKIEGDMRDLDLVGLSLKNIDHIIHLACISNDPSFDLDPNLGKSINFDCFEPTVKLASEQKVKRFIFASSSSVYGSKDEDQVTEDLSTEPQTDYAKYKLACEEILLKDKSEMIKSIVRPSTLCGYSDRQRFDLSINIFTNQALNEKKITVFGGSQMRPALHIQDMIDFYLLLLKEKKEKINNRAFNISKENFTILDIATRVRNIVDKNIEIDVKDVVDNRNYKISSERAKNELNFIPKYEIEHAVRELIEANKENKFTDPLNNSLYYNIKKMKEIKLT